MALIHNETVPYNFILSKQGTNDDFVYLPTTKDVISLFNGLNTDRENDIEKCITKNVVN